MIDKNPGLFMTAIQTGEQFLGDLVLLSGVFGAAAAFVIVGSFVVWAYIR